MALSGGKKTRAKTGVALTNQDVRALAKTILRGESPLLAADLGRRLKEEAKRMAKTATGFHLRFPKALEEDETFEESVEGWALKKEGYL